MAAEVDSKPSFSPFRKWFIALNVGVVILAVLAVVIVANYWSHRYFLRMQVRSQSSVKLFPRTARFLQTITNSIKVTLYYDKEDPFYTTIAELLTEYSTANPKISLRTIDYRRDPGAAQLLKTNYALMAAKTGSKPSTGMPWFNMSSSKSATTRK
jgi:hypothetical protein